MKLEVKIHTGDLVSPILSLENYFREGGVSIIQAVLTHTYFVHPGEVLKKRPTSRTASERAGNTIPDLTKETAPPGTRETAGRLFWTTTRGPRWPGRGTPGAGSRGAPATECAIFGEIRITPTRSPPAGTYATCRTGRVC